MKVLVVLVAVGVALLLAVVIGALLSEPRCPTCNQRFHAGWCPWRCI
jgi:hypothetical protein